MLVLIVDDFGIKYVGDNYLHHLRTVLANYYTITEDLNGNIYFLALTSSGTTLESMPNSRVAYSWMATLLLKYGHKDPIKPQLSLHCHRKINYGSKEQLVEEEDTSPKLNNVVIKRVQVIVGALLFYARAFLNRLLVGMSTIGSQQRPATEQNTAAIYQVLDHIATYLNYGINYQASDIVMAAHSDAGFNNESKARSCAGANIFLSENDPTPKWN